MVLRTVRPGTAAALVLLGVSGTLFVQEVARHVSQVGYKKLPRHPLTNHARRLNAASSKAQLADLADAVGLSEAEEEPVSAEEASKETGKGEGRKGKEGGSAEGEERGKESEEGEEGAEGEEAEKEAEEEEEEEELFTPEDLTCGICLLCFITFIMVLFYLVNWPDEDMRIYVWTVISTTISIFIAIFVFSSADLLAKTYLKPGTEMGKTVLGFSQLTVWFVTMQIAVAKVSGSLEEHPFEKPGSNSKVWHPSPAPSIDEQQLFRIIRFKSVSALLAHITAFAAINAGGCLQHMYPFDTSAPARFAVPPIMFMGQLLVGRLVRMLRLIWQDKERNKRKGAYASDSESERAKTVADDEKFNEEELQHWCLEKWDEETYEAEVDIAGLAISFLLVQACRFTITGVMPNNLGIEEPVELHPRSATWKLVGVGLACAFLCIVNVVIQTQYIDPAKPKPGTCMSTMKRVVLTARMAFAMAFAWSLFAASKWEIQRVLPQFEPNGVVSRVLLAMGISVVVFFVILVLDKMADAKCTGPMVDSTIVAIIGALSTLVGFAFEQSFDGAVEALADMCFKTRILAAELVLTVLVCLIVYPAWRQYILRTLITLEEKAVKNDPQGLASHMLSEHVAD